MQLLNITCGGSLIQDLPSQRPGLDHNASTRLKTLDDTSHLIKIQPGSHLASILGQPQIGTNTHHHQGIDKLGEGIVATAWADDGLPEVIELSSHPFAIGVQSHPESLVTTGWNKLFAALIKSLPPQA